jgi:GT2 family glycosyltransferase
MLKIPVNLLISIVIPTYNREEILCNTVSALLELSDQFYELIIVDQTQEHLPKTSAFLASLPKKVTIIKLSTPNLPKARNIGSKESRGDVVLFLDDDIKPLSTLIKAHAIHYEDPTIGGVAGRLLSPHGAVKNLDHRYYTSDFSWRYIRFDQDWELQDVLSAPGGNMSFRRGLIIKLGGFDEEFVGNAFREETDFCLKLRNSSYRIIFDPDAAVIHYWNTDGGCDHIRLGNPDFTSYYYYQDFVQNNIYFFLKHVPNLNKPSFIWELYRNHIGNKYNVKKGFTHFFLRHVAFYLGTIRAYLSWRRHIFSINKRSSLT